MKHFQKILIANRGEIAVRILKTAQKFGVQVLAVYSAEDAASKHVELADQAILLEGDELQQTYLNQDKLISIALDHGAQAIHPGYGFLSENAGFAEKVEQAGLAFIGGTPAQIRLMGEKRQAIAFVERLGVPIIPGKRASVDELIQLASELDLPILVKASGGGGGKGMEVVHDLAQLPKALKQAQRLALQYFGNDELLIEKYLPVARHIEVQVLGDGNGKAVHLFERECSIQRRYQKLIEEAPASSISENTKKKLYEAALTIVRAIEYRGAGTIEFLVDEQENFYFLEMNTRLQVEHPVTELITGIDLVEWQLRIALGEQLSLQQHQLTANGHAIELRICAEDPTNQFMPTSGHIHDLIEPESARWDSFLTTGFHLSSNYDSLLGKLIVHGQSRAEVLEQMRQSVDSLFVGGVKTNQQFLKMVLAQPAFNQNQISTRWLEESLPALLKEEEMAGEIRPVPELLVGYLLHHFYRPNSTDRATSWTEMGYWRFQQKFQVKLEEEWHAIEVSPKANSWQMSWENQLFQIVPKQWKSSSIQFSLNDKDIVIFISEEAGLSRIQYLSQLYSLQSNHVASQVQLQRKAVVVGATKSDRVVADLFGKVVDVLVKPGDVLQKGQTLLVIESMKSEFTIQSPANAVVKTIHVSKGHLVQDKELLVDLES